MNARKCDISFGTEFRISESGRICVADYMTTYGKTTIASSGIVEIGSVGLNRYDIIACAGHIQIGKNCKFGPMVIIYDHDHCFGADGIKEGYSIGEVIIGDNVWIGANCVILKNTHIGNNCVIGAGCVIHGSIPDNSLVTMDRELTIKQLKDRALKNE